MTTAAFVSAWGHLGCHELVRICISCYLHRDFKPRQQGTAIFEPGRRQQALWRNCEQVRVTISPGLAGHIGQWPDDRDLDSGYRMLPLEMCEMSGRDGGLLPAAAGPKPAACPGTSQPTNVCCPLVTEVAGMTSRDPARMARRAVTLATKRLSPQQYATPSAPRDTSRTESQVKTRKFAGHVRLVLTYGRG